MKRFFNKGRRELIARTFATLVQIAVGGAIASNILLKLTPRDKVLALLAVIALIVFAIMICPKRSDE